MILCRTLVLLILALLVLCWVVVQMQMVLIQLLKIQISRSLFFLFLLIFSFLRFVESRGANSIQLRLHYQLTFEADRTFSSAYFVIFQSFLNFLRDL